MTIKLIMLKKIYEIILYFGYAYTIIFLSLN